MEYLKYASLFILYSSVTSFVMIIINVIMYPAMLQGLINKKLPFMDIVKDLYHNFVESEDNSLVNRIGLSFLNSIASLGYQIGMFLYMILLVVIYSVLGLVFFNVVTYGLASIFTLMNMNGITHFFNFFNLVFEIYGFVIVAFLISTKISFGYYRYINERFNLKKKSFLDYFNALIKVGVFLVPIIPAYYNYLNNESASGISSFIANITSVVTLDELYANSLPALVRLTNGNYFVICSVISIVLVVLYDVGYTKRISGKANKKILKEIKQKQIEQDDKVKEKENELLSAKEELANIKQEKEKVQSELEEIKTKATFIDIEVDKEEVLNENELGGKEND